MCMYGCGVCVCICVHARVCVNVEGWFLLSLALTNLHWANESKNGNSTWILKTGKQGNWKKTTDVLDIEDQELAQSIY